MSAHRIAAAAGAAAALAVAACGSGGSSTGGAAPGIQHPISAYLGSPSPVHRPPSDFRLRDQHGRMVSLSAQRGRYAIVTFLYTHCPDVCPLIASNLGRALDQLGPAARHVRVLAVSVDPKGDTHAAVGRFIRLHELPPQFLYLTGSRAQLEPIWKAWHVAVDPKNLDTVDHSAYEALIDPRGVQRLIYGSNVTAHDVVHDLHRLGLRT